MAEKVEEYIDNEMNESMIQNNISNVLQLKTNEQMIDNALLESAKTKVEELTSQIQVKENVINTLNNKHLEYGKAVNEIKQNIKKINVETDDLIKKHEQCVSYVDEFKETLKPCSLLKQNIDLVNNKIVIDINNFNAETRNAENKYGDEIKKLELMHKKQDDTYNQQCSQYRNKLDKQNLLLKELEEKKNIIASQLKEEENYMKSLDADFQVACAQKSDMLVKSTEMKEKLDLKTKEYAMETDVLKRAIQDLQISLQEKKDRFNETKKKSQQAQWALDEQTNRMNYMKETQSNYEKQKLDLEQEKRDLENQYASLKKANKIELFDVQLKLRERQLCKKALEKQCLEAKQENVRLRNKSKATKQTMEDLKVEINRNGNIYKERQSCLVKIESSIQEMKYNQDIAIDDFLVEEEKGKKEIEEYETKIKMLTDKIATRKADSIEVRSNIENLRLSNETKELKNKELLEKMNQHNLKLEDRLKGINENLQKVLLNTEEEKQKIREASRKKIKNIKESIHTYKAEMDDSWKQEERALLEKKKSLNAALKCKRMEAEKERLSLEHVRNEIKSKSSLMSPPDDTVKIGDNTAAGYSRRTDLPVKKSRGTWKGAWSGSTTEELFASPLKEGQKNMKKLTDPEFINSSTNGSDSDKELKTKRRVSRKTKATKPVARGRKTKK